MTDGFDQAMIDAGLNLLLADVGPPPLVVFDGAPPIGVAAPTPPYVVVWSIVSWPEDPIGMSLNGLVTRATVRWICHCVGGDQRAARAVGQRVRTALLNKRPVIAGMQPGIIRDDQDDQPPDNNEVTGVGFVDAVHSYRLTCDT